MAVRKIVHIDESKCNGCGQCLLSCAEGALKLIDGKARLVRDDYCDGLGACLAKCPVDAILIEEREAAEFNVAAVVQHLKNGETAATTAGQRSPCGDGNSPAPTDASAAGDSGSAGLPVAGHPAWRYATQPPEREGEAALGGCPGVQLWQFESSDRDGDTAGKAGAAAASTGEAAASASSGAAPPAPSALRQWPVQLALVPPTAPFLRDADVLLVADCVPFALGDFHQRLLRGRVVLVGCPKLDRRDQQTAKLTSLLQQAPIRSLTVVHMQVPCCSGLKHMAQAAIQASGCTAPVREMVVSADGQVVTDQTWSIDHTTLRVI